MPVRKNRSQRNHIAMAMIAWIQLKTKAWPQTRRFTGSSMIHYRHLLLSSGDIQLRYSAWGECESPIELFAKTWQNNERPIHALNKFCKI
jgi:hypothetical protein